VSDELSRREFVVAVAGLLALPVRDSLAAHSPALVGLTRKSGHTIAGGYVDDDSARGHALRDGTPMPRARERRKSAVAIVGGGIGGLSAAWQLDKLGVSDWTLLELSGATGGNTRSGENPVSRYPWGAHYVPVPAHDATHVRQLFRELGLLTGVDTWDERTLCHSPQERLWQHGRWHEGLEPLDAMSAADRAQFTRFESVIDEWRYTRAFAVPSVPGHERGSAGKYAKALDALDAQTADAWLRAQGFSSAALRWWVEYGLRDDYGASLPQASAWAAVHYFAAREATERGPLTWPEGNEWISRRLTQRLDATRSGRIVTNAPAFKIERAGKRWLVSTPALEVECECVIWAAPLFVLPGVLPSVRVPTSIEYAPWVVANLTLSRAPSERGAPLAWDNVIYGSPSLGYVNAQHQSLATPSQEMVWTWYHAVVDRPSRDARLWLRQRPWGEWRDQIVNDLTRAHPDIADCVTRVDVLRWGHAMARPTPGVRARVKALQAWTPAPNVHIAHADMSGISLYEEAQWHGVHAAQAVARTLTAR